ncbi:hypothetical protein ACMZ6Y_02960 [Streptococcus pluranimalium]|uniref:Uncharacterized protein n=1 Tax=Streptococcus agalactiae LMG 14747 TaxID=1154860 RepID=V6Z4A5_STRAG|nr:hypothetical protein [Streptococcus hyovaginalis]ESV55106.1 hypothetical protein SAG0136_07775 [Streptococcus agalactiae LMG 14747]MDY4511306.1 hypothetical protein [Streptococcus hyovaginalis]
MAGADLGKLCEPAYLTSDVPYPLLSSEGFFVFQLFFLIET